MKLTELDEYNLELAHKFLDLALDCIEKKRRARAQEFLTESITYYAKIPKGHRDDDWEEKAKSGLPKIMGSHI